MYGDMRGMGMHGDMRHGHMHTGMRKNWMGKMMYIEKMMEHLSEEDKKKLAASKIDAEISMTEKKMEIMEEKKKIMAMKFDLRKDRLEKKTEIYKELRDMLNKKD